MNKERERQLPTRPTQRRPPGLIHDPKGSFSKNSLGRVCARPQTVAPCGSKTSPNSNQKASPKHIKSHAQNIEKTAQKPPTILAGLTLLTPLHHTLHHSLTPPHYPIPSHCNSGGSSGSAFRFRLTAALVHERGHSALSAAGLRQCSQACCHGRHMKRGIACASQLKVVFLRGGIELRARTCCNMSILKIMLMGRWGELR